MTEEDRVKNDIRLAIDGICVNFRANVGKVRTPDGRFFSTGLPVGFSDIFGVRKSDGRAVFIEAKTKTGRPTPEQLDFIKSMKEYGAIAGVCRTSEEAIKLIEEDL